jgi:transcription antitermination factor NusG
MDLVSGKRDLRLGNWTLEIPCWIFRDKLAFMGAEAGASADSFEWLKKGIDEVMTNQAHAATDQLQAVTEQGRRLIEQDQTLTDQGQTLTAQPFCYPGDLFSVERPGESDIWICVRTRPRWEKKFSRWLVERGMSHYLPVYMKRTVSHRKVRITEMPLFPGFVFVLGRWGKIDFVSSCCVVRILAATSERANRRLAEDIRTVFRMLTIGRHPALVNEWIPGQRIRVISGPLAGSVGRYVRDSGGGLLVAWFDLLGVGASVRLDAGTVVEAE